MDEREQQRKVKHRLAMIYHAQEVTGNVAQTCRYYGISHQRHYKWRTGAYITVYVTEVASDDETTESLYNELEQSLNGGT